MLRIGSRIHNAEDEMRPLLLLCVSYAAFGCSGGDSSPASPSPATSSIVVTVDNPLKIGATAQASATATLSNGQTQNLTTGFQSDAPGVASVTPTGAVTGVSNGRATIFVSAS